MKRIGLLLSCTPEYGGSFQYSLNMLDAVAGLPQSRYKSVVAYIDPVWDSYIAPYAHVEHHQLDLTRTVEPPCDLWIFPAQESWDFQKEAPVLTAIHDLMHRYEGHFAEVSADGAYEQREAQYANICRWSRGVLVDSETGCRQVMESYGLSRKNIFILPFVPPLYIHHNASKSDVGEKYALPSKYLFYPAHFWPHKNHEMLIRAIAVLKDELPDIHLVLAGSEKEGFDSILQLVQHLQVEPYVHFTGYVPDEDMPELYRRARALVMPTSFGPTNIPPLEAFALECPVAISRVYGMPEQVGDAAILFDPYSIEEVTDGIRRLWVDDELCRTLISKGKKRAASWNQKHFNHRVLEIIDCIVKGG